MVARVLILFFAVIFFSGCATARKGQDAKQQQLLSETKYRTEQLQSSEKESDFGSQWDGSQDFSSNSRRQKDVGITQLSARQIQTSLKNAGFYKGPVDGKIGPKTKEAIRSFQKAKGLKPDGIVGKRTSSELSKYLER